MLNKPKATENKADMLIKQSSQAQTSTDKILSELSKINEPKVKKSEPEPKPVPVEKTEKTKPVTEKKEESISPKTVSSTEKPSKKESPSKVGRKRIYDKPRHLIHVKVTDELKQRIDKACEARNLTMQGYIEKLIENDLTANEARYDKVLENKNFD